MGKCYDTKCVFPLTSLQIGDLQSYLSDLSLFLAIESNKFYILVDNRPWLRDLGSRPTHLWQLMVTKSRLSPFANTKARKERKEGKDTSSKPVSNKSKRLERWFSLIDAATLSRKRVLLPVKTLRSHLLLSNELHRTLYGFIIFEVAWTNVRGINYLNELQTDTSLAIEAKFMQRWEFDSISQAASCISSWFSGTFYERQQLNEYLDSAIGDIFYDAKEDFSRTVRANDDEKFCHDNQCTEDTYLKSIASRFSACSGTIEGRTTEPHTPPPTGPYKRRKVTKCTSAGVEVDMYTEETQNEFEDLSYNSVTCTAECENSVEATQYCDVLILFRFNDRDLPFKLRQVIMSDLRLLTLLEAGLPSWVIFLQSYPGFCHMYRPWMCPLARALYVIISVVTVLIGFYDLYKNVPVLKATASRLCGPFFDWIETWEMVSRIKYLGTMLFLHNFQKAVKWFLAITRTMRSFFSVITLPLAEPFMEILSFLIPMWNTFFQAVESVCSVIWTIIDSSYSLVGDIIEVILLPISLIISVFWKIANSVLYPIFWTLWEILYAPIRIVLALGSLVALIFASMSELLGDIWQTVSSIFQFAAASEVTVTTYEVSMWRSLWNDLFSQIFRAVRSILNGFVAFFTACNRHRLSIYNHIQDFIQRLLGRTQRSQPSDTRHNRATRRAQNLSEVRKIHIN
ncbi:G1/S-specific cyclin-E protein [Melia azedarach]|uniref:G1/S-specific cyclin-E protein n=1 Tax=Melia azedarach TaxID=155640 RepID=A0ACC1Z2W6_MELAZ|nr:G1/S-specific cyclin-E protein [Melia azedarach]